MIDDDNFMIIATFGLPTAIVAMLIPYYNVVETLLICSPLEV